MKRLFILALLIAPLALAQVPRTVTLQHATERMDGSPLALAEIERAEVECMPVGGPAVTAFAIVPPNTSRETDPIFEPGTSYQCRARTVDTAGRVSPDWSESQVFTVGSRCAEDPAAANCEPKAPLSITVILE